MNIDLTQYIVPSVLIACWIVGYCIKKSFDFIPNKYIPTILCVFGAVLNVCINGFTWQALICGAVTGIFSVGGHQLFKGWMEGSK